MKKQELKDIISKLKASKELDKYPLVYLMDLPRSKDLSDLDKDIAKDEMYIYIYNDSTKPLTMGEIFEVLVPLNDPLSYIETSIQIKYFSMNRKIEIEQLHNGFSAIGLLKFKDGIPPVIHRMKEYMSKSNDDTVTFYLMSRNLLCEILNCR